MKQNKESINKIKNKSKYIIAEQQNLKGKIGTLLLLKLITNQFA